jgi:hypothetical protein
LYGQLFSNPLRGYEQAIMRLSRVLTAYHGYVSLSGVIGIAVQKQYTTGNFDTTFLHSISEIATNLVQGTAALFADEYLPGSRATVEIPKLENQSWVVAQKMLEERGLKLAINETEPLTDQTNFEQGRIVKQAPLAEARALTGSIVQVTLSKKAPTTATTTTTTTTPTTTTPQPQG